MGFVGRVALALALSAGAACARSERGVQGKRLPASALVVKSTSQSGPREGLYDAQGNLKASSTTVDWLPIPEGFTEHKGRGTQHVFSASVPLKAVTRYMDARAFTGDIQVSPTSVRYGAARPKSLDAHAMPLDVSLYTNGAGNHVDLIIDERPPVVGKPMTADEVRSLLMQKQARAE
jgi:hypothetical protein